MSVTRTPTAIPPQTYFVGSAIFHYLGPAFAVLLFARVDVVGVAWLRIASAALIFACWRRPWHGLRELEPSGRWLLAGWGVVLAVMNVCFYEAIAHLPLGTVAAIEFLPVILVAALGARRPRNLAALGLAVTGVYLLTDVRLAGETAGFAVRVRERRAVRALHRARRPRREAGHDGRHRRSRRPPCWSRRSSSRRSAGSQPRGPSAIPIAIAAGLGVGITSSVIPYVCDQLALARIARATYALLVSLLPATATVIGIAVLTQIPSWPEARGSRPCHRGRRVAPPGPGQLI